MFSFFKKASYDNAQVKINGALKGLTKESGGESLQNSKIQPQGSFLWLAENRNLSTTQCGITLNDVYNFYKLFIDYNVFICRAHNSENLHKFLCSVPLHSTKAVARKSVVRCCEAAGVVFLPLPARSSFDITNVHALCQTSGTSSVRTELLKDPKS